MPGDRAGHFMNNGYRMIGLRGYKILEHRAIFAICHGHWPQKHIDHIDGDHKNNRIENLRDVTVSQNLQNKHRARSDSKSGILGVSFNKNRGKYYAELWLNGKKVFSKGGLSLDEAVKERRAAEARFFTHSPARQYA